MAIGSAVDNANEDSGDLNKESWDKYNALRSAVLEKHDTDGSHSSDGDVVLKSLFDANTILTANSDDTPAALTVGLSTIVGRASTGNIAALTPTQVNAMLGVNVTKALDNLVSVAINTSLISDTDDTDDLGSSSVNWRHLYLSGKIVQSLTGATITDEEHALDVDYGGACSSGDSMVAGNFAVTPTGTGATWASGLFAKVTQGTTKAVNGYFSGGEFECNVGAMSSNLSDFGVLVLNWNSAATSSMGNVTHGAYMLLRDYGTQPIGCFASFIDASLGTKSDTSIVTTIGTTSSTNAVRIQIGTTYYWLLATSVAPSTT